MMIKEDHRGKIFILPFKDTEFLFIKTKKNKKRGGHYHLTLQHHLVLDGIIEWHNIIGNNNICRQLKSGDVITILPNVPHYMVSITDSWTVEWKDTIEQIPHNVPELRKMIEND